MYTKSINPHFVMNGKRRTLDGYLGELHDGELLIHSQVYGTFSQAERELDRLVFELLTDLHEQGLVDSVPAAMVAEGVTSHQLPSWQPTDCPICDDGSCPWCARGIAYEPAPSLYERIVAECQAELDARPVVMVVDVDRAA